MSNAEPTITLGGLGVAFKVDGPVDAPVIMFGNGLATASPMWDRQATHFASRFRVLRYDVRGHGGSGASPPPYTLELLADDAVALLDALGIRKVTYVGLSLGGMIGQVFAVRHTNRVGTLVLCDTTMCNRRAMWNERIGAIEANGLEPQVEPSIERWFTPSFRADRPDVVEEMRHMIRTTSMIGYLGCAMAMREMRLGEVTRRIAQPTLVVTGAQDQSTPVEDARELHAVIARSRLEVIDNAAHLPNIEQAERFNAMLDDFFAANPVLP